MEGGNIYRAWCHYDLGRGLREGISRGLESLTDWGRGEDSVKDVNISKYGNICPLW